MDVKEVIKNARAARDVRIAVDNLRGSASLTQDEYRQLNKVVDLLVDIEIRLKEEARKVQVWLDKHEDRPLASEAESLAETVYIAECGSAPGHPEPSVLGAFRTEEAAEDSLSRHCSDCGGDYADGKVFEVGLV